MKPHQIGAKIGAKIHHFDVLEIGWQRTHTADIVSVFTGLPSWCLH